MTLRHMYFPLFCKLVPNLSYFSLQHFVLFKQYAFAIQIIDLHIISVSFLCTWKYKRLTQYISLRNKSLYTSKLILLGSQAAYFKYR